MIQDVIKEKIKSALTALDVRAQTEIELEHPTQLGHGDYSSNIAMVLADDSTNPRELAQKVVAEIEKDLPGEIKKVEVAGPGFINFYLSREFFAVSLKKIMEAGDRFGSSTAGNDRAVVVEYSSPNIAKPFTVGHLRSTVIGDAIANILAFTGHSVIRDNHLGDWGTQFGKTLYALDAWGDIEEIENSDEPMKALVDLYVRFHKEAEEDDTLEEKARGWFKRLEDDDKKARKLLDKLRTWSLNEFADIYNRLGVSFDTQHGESKFAPLTEEVIKDLETKDLIAESEGAKLVFFGDPDTDPEEHEMPPLLIKKSDGTTIYAARDLATDKWRKEEYGDDITIINEVGSEQTLYFKQLFEVEEKLGYFQKNQRHHVTHGLFRFADQKMSTREGNVIWLEDLLDEAVERAAEFDPDVAELVGVGALKYNDLKRDPIKDIVFDWDEALNLEGDSGPYLQYAHARAKSVLKGAKKANLKPEVKRWPEKTTDLERLLYRFPEVVERSAKDFAPRYIATYLHKTAQEFNTFYGGTKIIADDEQASYRLALTAATAQVIKNGLNLLGIQAPEEM